MNLGDYSLGSFQLTDILILTNILLTLIVFIMIIVTKVKFRKIRKNYDVFMSGKDGKSLEEEMMKRFRLLELLDESVTDIYSKIEAIDKNLLLTYQKMGFVKYDAFKEKGGQMSFVLVLLTKENNGVMMNCMHSNVDGCYTYVKRIENGTSKLTLSKEEEVALGQALGEKME
mgnify:FL=1